MKYIHIYKCLKRYVYVNHQYDMTVPHQSSPKSAHSLRDACTIADILAELIKMRSIFDWLLLVKGFIKIFFNLQPQIL